MFAAGSIKSSKWGWDYKGYTVKYDASYSSVGGTVGAWSPLTLAPNGFYYALPRVWTKNGGVAANDVLCFKPGKSNNKNNKWQASEIFLAPGNGGKQPALPSVWSNTSPSGQFRFPSKGVLAPNGYIYFFGFGERSYICLKPQTDTSLSPVTATEWDVVKYNQTSPQIDQMPDNSTTAGGSFYSGGILGRDGYIYLIPSPSNINTNFTVNQFKQRTVRIAPRNTAINGGSVDIVELGYYNVSTGARLFNRNANPRPYAYGVDSTGAELTIPSDITQSAYDSYGKALSNAIVHPNGKIYLFGGVSKRMYILDPTKWGTSSEIYTNNNIYIPNSLTGNPNRGWHGNSYTATLEKLKPGQDPNTLKIFFALGDGNGSVTNDTTKKYTSAIAFDPVTDTFDASFYNDTTNEGITLMTNPTQGIGPNSSSFIHFPNGHVLQATISVSANENTYSKLLYIGKNNETKFIGPVNRNILSYTERQSLYETYTHAAGQAGWGSSTPGISSSFGKTLYSSISGACEITSVKGFYPRIKHFSYNQQNFNFNSSTNTITGSNSISSNQVKLLGINLTGTINANQPFYFKSSDSLIDSALTVSSISFSGNDTTITVSGTPFFPNYQTSVQGVNFISATQLEISMTFEEFNNGQSWNNKKIYIEGLNTDYFTTTSSGYFYNSGTETLTLTFPASTFENIGNDANALLYYADPAIDEGSIFIYGQLVAFPDSETLRIWGVDLTNSMYNIDSVVVSGAGNSSNNGLKQIYSGSSPFYSNGYTDLTFAPGTFTTEDYNGTSSVSFQYDQNDADIYDIPSDLSTLPTSLWNAYFNKPR